jgi:hypothetical protein
MQAATRPRRLLGAVVLIALEASFATSRLIRFGLLWLLVLGGAHLWSAWRSRRSGWRRTLTAPETLVPVSAIAVLLVALQIHGKTIAARVPALRFLMQHGVIGDNPTAQWVGVDEWVRTHTPPDAVLLPIATYDYPYRQGLRYNSFLRTRTGRSMVCEPQWDAWFNYEVIQSVVQDRQHMDRLIEAWKEEDLGGVQAELRYFPPVDYIIVDSSAAGWIKDRLPGFRPEAVVGRFTVLRAHADTRG